jgi:hypothetical protein
MDISRKKFNILFIVSGFVFLGITTSLLGTTGPRGFPQAPDSVLRTGSDSPVAWKRAVAMVILPIKAVLVWPLVVPGVHLLNDDPPPPFVGIFLMAYWYILASGTHYLIGKLKRS